MRRACAAVVVGGLLSVLAGMCAAAEATSIHVSGSGSDANDGSLAKPFATLERARQAVRDALKSAGGGVEVVIAPGTYRLQRTLELTAEDSRPGRPVVWRAAGEVRLSGGLDIPASACKTVSEPAELARLDASARGQVLRVDLKALGVKDFGSSVAPGRRPELFINDQPQTLARWPNEGFVKIKDVVKNQPYTSHGIKGDRVGVLVYEGDRPARWKDEPDACLHGYWFWDWSDEYKKIDAIDPAAKRITLGKPDHGYGYRKDQRYYALNLLCELDAPGEWYIDRKAGVLYFWPPTAGASARVVLSLMDQPLVRLDRAADVTLRGLTLEACRGAAVSISNCIACRVSACTLRNLGGSGVSIRGGSACGVSGCDIFNVGASGVSLSGGDRNTLTAGGHFATNNHIHHFGRLKRTYSGAIHVHGVGNRAANNLIHDAPHLAVAFGGNENVMELNEIHHVCQETGDVGVFYTGRDWTVRGNVLRHNFIHDVSGPGLWGAQGIYLDDAASGSIVIGNVLYKVARAFLLGGGRDNVIQNNLVVECGESIRFDNRGLGWMKDTITGTMPQRLKAMPYRQPPWSTKYPQLLTVLDDQPGSPKGNILVRNVIYRSKKMSLAPEVTKFGTVKDNLETADDLGFRDPAKMDFRLKDDSPLRTRLPGFEPIPMERIGLRVDAERPRLPGR
ncbi:MAG TPA: right-handed parallel beta-helix repeat-containing protein [Phycisphaerae bacterium]|nr:right-handed parallel beta-helix repeat-containing protein [Phycisphaerae bacterium]HQL75057.1 right-handed parallel beta-helix repeat-containing protein [Phycisphaerae bacterium]